MTRHLAAIGALVAAALVSAGCYTMSPITLNDLGAAPTARVWVTRADQSTVVIHGPRVIETRLVGFVDKQYLEVPVADVTLVRAKRMAPLQTTAMVAAGLVGAAAIIAVVSSSGRDPDPCITGEMCPFPQ